MIYLLTFHLLYIHLFRTNCPSPSYVSEKALIDVFCSLVVNRGLHPHCSVFEWFGRNENVLRPLRARDLEKTALLIADMMCVECDFVYKVLGWEAIW